MKFIILSILIMTISSLISVYAIKKTFEHVINVYFIIAKKTDVIQEGIVVNKKKKEVKDANKIITPF